MSWWTWLLLAVGALLLACGAVLLWLYRLWRRRPVPGRAGDGWLTVHLAGVASATLPADFQFEGLVNSGRLRWRSGEFTTLPFHLDPERLSCRFTAGAYFDLGGIRRVPLSLDLTLEPPAGRRKARRAPSSTTIDRFYAAGRGPSWLEEQNWSSAGQTEDEWLATLAAPDLTHAAAAPAWLILWRDRRQGVRVDLFVWQERLALAAAVALVRAVGASVATTPALAAHFAAIPEFPARLAARRAQNRAAVERALAPFALPPAAADTCHWSGGCGVWWSADQRRVGVLRALGEAAAAPPPAPFPLSLLEQDAEGQWRARRAGGGPHHAEPWPPLLAAFAARCTLQRKHWFWYQEYDLEAPNAVIDLAERLEQCARWAE